MSFGFTVPPVTDDDIRWAAGLMGLAADAFHGADGKDPRAAVIQLTETADIAACPGSGKTTLLVAKLAILASKWEHPTRGVCVLSHTNVAREEIEKRLGGCQAGQQLLRYPHFVGTIHSFVNEFLAIPWLRSLGYPINLIDTDIATDHRWGLLDGSSKFFLGNVHFDKLDLTAKKPDFSVGNVSLGKGKATLGTGTSTYKEMVRVCAQSAIDGYFAHSEMFMWAADFLAKRSEMIAILRQRFPLVFIDESQDNDDEQSKLLYQMFGQGGAPSICQRFGDPNQAIFDRIGSKAPTGFLFPIKAIKKDLPNSHRFGQRIADIADPLGVIPYKLRGEGPKKQLASKAPNAEHTIFLFKDKAGAGKVLSRFGELLLATFSDAELKDGVFKAVGQIHRARQDDVFPGHVGHYWQGYQPELSRSEPRPASFVEGITLGIEKGRKAAHVGVCAQKIADCVLEAARRSDKTVSFRKAENRHRFVCELLEDNTPVRKEYEALVRSVAIDWVCSRAQWNAKMRGQVRAAVEHICHAKLSEAGERFLDWPAEPVLASAALATEKRHPNVYRHRNGAREVFVQIGSIHSVKGETHSAILVVETFFHELNIDSIKDWFLGTKTGEKKGAKRINARLKLHYVALTRPTHLVCVAMMHSSFETTAGVLDAAKVKLLKCRGWQVRVI